MITFVSGFEKLQNVLQWCGESSKCLLQWFAEAKKVLSSILQNQWNIFSSGLENLWNVFSITDQMQLNVTNYYYLSSMRLRIVNPLAKLQTDNKVHDKTFLLLHTFPAFQYWRTVVLLPKDFFTQDSHIFLNPSAENVCILGLRKSFVISDGCQGIQTPFISAPFFSCDRFTLKWTFYETESLLFGQLPPSRYLLLCFQETHVTSLHLELG